MCLKTIEKTVQIEVEITVRKVHPPPPSHAPLAWGGWGSGLLELFVDWFSDRF